MKSLSVQTTGQLGSAGGGRRGKDLGSRGLKISRSDSLIRALSDLKGLIRLFETCIRFLRALEGLLKAPLRTFKGLRRALDGPLGPYQALKAPIRPFKAPIRPLRLLSAT